MKKPEKRGVFPGCLNHTHTTAAAVWSKHTGMGHLQPEQAQFAWSHPQFSANGNRRGISIVFILLSPGLKSDILGENSLLWEPVRTRRAGKLLIPDFPEPAATSRFIAYLSQSRKYYYNRQSMKLQPLFSKNFSAFLRLFPFFQFAPYLVLSPARHTTDEAKNGTARPPRLSFYRTLSMHLQALRAGNPSFPPAHARLQRTRTAYPAHRP